jgi:hypothetical protein
MVQIVEARRDRKERERYESELRDRIFEHPSLLPGFEGPTAAAKEVEVRRAGPADVVVVNPDGQIAIVECKRASNQQSRRTVIGQLFEYAAGLWKNQYEDLERIFEASETRSGAKLTEPFEHVPGWDEKTFRSNVSRTLIEGDFRLFIAVDEMTQPLKKRLDRTVTFLNSRLSEVEFLAVALPPGGDPESPYGGDPERIFRLPPHTERSKVMAQIDSEDAELVAEELFDWADQRKSRGVEVRCPTKKQCFIEVPDADGGTHAKREGLFKVRPTEVRVSLGPLRRRHWDEERISRFVQALTKIDPKFNIDTKSKGQRPEAPLESLREESKRKDFLDLMEEALDTLTG